MAARSGHGSDTRSCRKQYLSTVDASRVSYIQIQHVSVLRIFLHFVRPIKMRSYPIAASARGTTEVPAIRRSKLMQLARGWSVRAAASNTRACNAAI